MKCKDVLLAVMTASLIGSPALLADASEAARHPAVVKDVANHLYEFEKQASKVGHDAENLWMISRDHHTVRQSHAYYLNNLRDAVNSMGRLLAELEQMKPLATEAQQMAIENARPHLVALANETTEALDLVRTGDQNTKPAQYKETIAELSKQADILSQTLDTIVDYHEADDRLDELEASHEGSGN